VPKLYRRLRLHVTRDAWCRENDGGGGEGLVDREAAAGYCRCRLSAPMPAANRMRHTACDRVASQVHIGDMQWEGVLDFQR